MPPSKEQEQRQKDALKKWVKLVYEDGKTHIEANKEVGYSSSSMERIRRKYLPNNFESDLKDKGFAPDNWSHGWLKTEDCSIFIKNQDKIVTYDQIKEDFVNMAKKHAPKYKKIDRKKITDPHLLVMDIADLHVGKYSSKLDTGEEYNIEIAKRRAIDGLHGLIAKCVGFPIEKTLLVVGNDILHVDSPHRKTTSGTPQDTDKQWYDAYLAAKEVYIEMVETLLPIADIHVIFNPSNHDYMSGGMLVDSLGSWFRNCPNITFDIDMRHRKYYAYGKSLIGTSHGDGAKEKDLMNLMSVEAKELWGASQYRNWYLHHYHHMRAIDTISGAIQYLRSPTAADRWHNVQGYITQPAVQCFIHHRDQGQIGMFSHPVT